MAQKHNAGIVEANPPHLQDPRLPLSAHATLVTTAPGVPDVAVESTNRRPVQGHVHSVRLANTPKLGTPPRHALIALLDPLH